MEHTGKRALVLAGGGAKGSYQIGVWRALQELDWTPDIITGASVGALKGRGPVAQPGNSRCSRSPRNAQARGAAHVLPRHHPQRRTER